MTSFRNEQTHANTIISLVTDEGRSNSHLGGDKIKRSLGLEGDLEFVRVVDAGPVDTWTKVLE